MSFQQSRGPRQNQDYSNRGHGRGAGGRQHDGGTARPYTPRSNDGGGNPRPYTPRSNDGGGDRGGFRGGRGRGRGGGNFTPRPSGEARPHCLTGEGAIFPVEIEPDAKVYRYEVKMLYKSKKFNGESVEHDMTTEKRDSRARQFCYHVLSHLMEVTHNFGNPKIEVAYDNQNTLLSNLPFSRVIEEIERNDLPDEASVCLAGHGQIYVEITENEKMPTIDLNDLAQYEARELLLNEDQTVRQMLEIILSQGAINSGDYDVVGNGELFRKKEDKVERGFCTRIGSSKGIRMIDMETKDSNGQVIKKIKPAMVIDFKKSPFYCSGLFVDLVLEFIRGCRGNQEEAYREAEVAFKNIRLSPIYQPNRVLRFSNFTSKPFSELTLTDDSTGETMTLVNFFLKKKHRRLLKPDLRGVTCQRDGDFPMELLQVLRNQRVDMQYIPSYIRDNVHRQNAVEPQIRYNNIIDEVHHLNFNNEVTKAFGISLNLEPVEKATVLQFDRPEKPKILLGGGKIINPQDDGRFNIGFGCYYHPATIEKWAVLFPSNANGEDVKGFVDKFVKAAEDRGIKFKSPPKPTQFRGTRFADLRQIFENFQKEGVQYVLMVDKKNNIASHGILKLVESLFKIVTQQVTLETLQKILHQNQNVTLANVLYKFNVKNGGTNYVPQFTEAAKRLDINTGKVLVIGYDVSHPTSCNPEERSERMKKGFESETRDPSIVGISANYTAEPSVFAGDFFFQPTRQEKVDGEELKIRTQKILLNIKKNRGHIKGFKMPEIIVILRDGVSEGQFRMACEDELPALRAGCYLFDPNYKPKFVFIVATKRHHKRFFEGKDGRFVNPAAGSFVDENVVRPDCVEFFMACHKAIKGTAKFVQVCVIQDDLKVTRDELKHFLHSLCYGHQVVTSPTSLPTPIYISDELATRGSEIYKTLKDEAPKHIPWKGEEINYIELTNMLGYFSSDLANVRFNA